MPSARSRVPLLPPSWSHGGVLTIEFPNNSWTCTFCNTHLVPKLLHGNKLWHGIAPRNGLTKYCLKVGHLGDGRWFKWNTYALLAPIEVLMDCVFNTYGFLRMETATIHTQSIGNPSKESQQHTQQTPVIVRMRVCDVTFNFNDPSPMMFGSWTLGFPETKGHRKLHSTTQQVFSPNSETSQAFLAWKKNTCDFVPVVCSIQASSSVSER